MPPYCFNRLKIHTFVCISISLSYLAILYHLSFYYAIGNRSGLIRSQAVVLKQSFSSSRSQAVFKHCLLIYIFSGIGAPKGYKSPFGRNFVLYHPALLLALCPSTHP